MNYIIYKTIKFIGSPIFRLAYRPRSYGENNIPKNGSVILAGNHVSVLDALIMVSTPKRIVHMMAKKELFKSKFTNFFFRILLYKLNINIISNNIFIFHILN